DQAPPRAGPRLGDRTSRPAGKAGTRRGGYIPFQRERAGKLRPRRMRCLGVHGGGASDPIPIGLARNPAADGVTPAHPAPVRRPRGRRTVHPRPLEHLPGRRRRPPASVRQDRGMNLNDLSPAEAETGFLSCCGSRTWARRMTEGRPYGDGATLLETADQVWWSLAPEDWGEAFAAHPQIGEKKIEGDDRFRRWSEQEQAGVASAETALLAELAEANRA